MLSPSFALTYREDICLQTLLLLFKYANHKNKRSFVSTANEALVGTLMTIADVNNIFPILFGRRLLFWNEFQFSWCFRYLVIFFDVKGRKELEIIYLKAVPRIFDFFYWKIVTWHTMWPSKKQILASNKIGMAAKLSSKPTIINRNKSIYLFIYLFMLLFLFLRQPVSKDCVTNLSRKDAFTIVSRLSSIVYRLSSIVWVLAHA